MTALKEGVVNEQVSKTVPNDMALSISYRNEERMRANFGGYAIAILKNLWINPVRKELKEEPFKS